MAKNWLFSAFITFHNRKSFNEKKISGSFWKEGLCTLAEYLSYETYLLKSSVTFTYKPASAYFPR